MRNRRAVAMMFAIGGTLSAPATVLAQTGQNTSGTAGKAGPSYTVCTPSASNNYCKQTGPISQSAPAGGGGGNNGDYGCVSYGKCSQANVSSGDLMITVEPGFTNLPNLATLSGPAQAALTALPAPYDATLSVTHNDHNGSCEKIYQVVVNTPWNGGHADIAHATVPNGGECNFSNFTFRFQPMSLGEVQACTAGGVLKNLHVVLMSHNMWGQLTKDDHADTFTTVRVVVRQGTTSVLNGLASATSSEVYGSSGSSTVTLVLTADRNGGGVGSFTARPLAAPRSPAA